MHCAEHAGHRLIRWGGLAALMVWLAGCALPGTPPTAPAPAAESPGRADTGLPVPSRGASAPRPLPPPTTPRSWEAARLQAAHRLVAANPERTYTGQPPDVLLAIPVLTIELHADGRIRHIEVMRYPGQARDTVELAKEAVRRAAPFGDVSKLPRPWKFNETFLFNAERKFKPMTLDRR